MQIPQAKQIKKVLPQSNQAQPKVAPQPWVKPTFERMPLNEALAAFDGNGSDNGSYAS